MERQRLRIMRLTDFWLARNEHGAKWPDTLDGLQNYGQLEIRWLTFFRDSVPRAKSGVNKNTQNQDRLPFLVPPHQTNSRRIALLFAAHAGVNESTVRSLLAG